MAITNYSEAAASRSHVPRGTYDLLVVHRVAWDSFEREDGRADGAAGDRALERRGRVRERECGSDVERQEPIRECCHQDGKPSTVRADVDVRDRDSSFG